MPQYHDLGLQLLSRLEAVAQHAETGDRCNDAAPVRACRPSLPTPCRSRRAYDIFSDREAQRHALHQGHLCLCCNVELGVF